MLRATCQYLPVLLTVLVSCSRACAQSAAEYVKAHPDIVPAYKEACKAYTEAQVKRELADLGEEIGAAETRLARAKKTPVKPGKSNVTDKYGAIVAFRSKSAKEDAIANLEQFVAPLRKRFDELKSGSLTMLHPLNSTVEGSIGAVSAVSVQQVHSENGLLGRFPKNSGYRDDLIWVEMPTRGMVDGKTYEFSTARVFIVTGTKTYLTVIGGTKTLTCVSQYELPKD